MVQGIVSAGFAQARQVALDKVDLARTALNQHLANIEERAIENEQGEKLYRSRDGKSAYAVDDGQQCPRNDRH